MELMRTLRRLAAFGVLSIASATPALAQRVRGVVVRADSVTPLAGAIVIAEEARKAMITTQLSAGGAPLVAEWIEYDLTTDASARLIRQQRVKTSRNPTTHAFKSQPAATLHDKGYIVVEGDATTYYAPDAEA